jgi:hypothetical protein
MRALITRNQVPELPAASAKSRDRGGFTFIELLVVIFVHRLAGGAIGAGHGFQRD